MKLEVIVFDKESMIAAQEGGATQVELVTDLDQDGLTPSIELVKEVMSVATIPVHVMLRNSNTFQHSDKEMKEMLKYAKELIGLNVPGVVWGSLDEERKVNVKQLKKLQSICEGKMKIIFHRAADFSRCPIEAWDTLRDNGVKHLLTSGGPNKAIEGIQMINLAKAIIEDVLIGSGISKDNVEEIVKGTGINQVHVGSSVWSEKQIVDSSKVKEIKELLN